jgi:hypothetical protein
MFQFPPNPVAGQIFDAGPGIKFRWNGKAWFLVGPFLRVEDIIEDVAEDVAIRYAIALG